VVIPVTAVGTEIQYAPRERTLVQYLDGASEEVAIGRISEFVSETDNPENAKRVRSVRIESPSLEFCAGIRLVDTPGLESVLAHNTSAAMEWLPNAGLALVAVAADAPLSQRDIELLQNLRRFTPNVSLLLTKVDLLTEAECDQVRKFVEKQLALHLDAGIPVYPYSVRPGFEDLVVRLQEKFLARVKIEATEQRAEILRHKLDSPLGECADYVTLALRAAQTSDSEREELKKTNSRRQSTA